MIEFKNVHFGFPQQPIFQGVNFEIPLGGLVWVQGANGHGKTTFLRLILDFLRPQSGKVLVPKKLKLGWGPAVDNSFFPRFTGKENLNFFLNLTDDPKDKNEIFELAFFKDELIVQTLQTPFYQMSSGMKQILILMRSMLANPDVIILDEPMRGLDVAHQAAFQKLLLDLINLNKTLIITSHLPINFEFARLCIINIDHD